MYLHWVVVTKYRRGMFTKGILEDLRQVLARVCTDFEATLVEFDDEDDHVHLAAAGAHPLPLFASTLRNIAHRTKIMPGRLRRPRS